MLLLRANALAVGLSGVRPEVVELLIGMLNREVHPVVPVARQRRRLWRPGAAGPPGAGGDRREGRRGSTTPDRAPGPRRWSAPGCAVDARGQGRSGAPERHPADGCHGRYLALEDARRLAVSADVIGAMSLEAMLGTASAFDQALVEARPHRPAGRGCPPAGAARRLGDRRFACRERPQVQDAYSLRCMPQVHGAVRDALDQLERVLNVEMNAATDNPLVFPSGEVISGGNFHGEPLATAIDYAKMAVAELASISKRRSSRLVDAHLSGLPAFLTDAPGLRSGLMMAQYSAAALVNELQTLSHPRAWTPSRPAPTRKITSRWAPRQPAHA